MCCLLLVKAKCRVQENTKKTAEATDVCVACCIAKAKEQDRTITCPEGPCGPPSLLINGKEFISGGKTVGSCR